MISYASIDRIEGEYAVCELELVDVMESKKMDFEDKETAMVDIPMTELELYAKGAREGDILIVKHNNGDVVTVYCRDYAEKQRRIKMLQEIMGQ